MGVVGLVFGAVGMDVTDYLRHSILDWRFWIERMEDERGVSRGKLPGAEGKVPVRARGRFRFWPVLAGFKKNLGQVKILH